MAKINADDLRLHGITKERFMVGQIRKYLPDYPIIMLSGPRKVGKTTLLLQLAAGDENVEYIDCGEEADKVRLKELLYSDFNGLLLVDEFQKLNRHQDWIQAFHNRVGEHGNFRTVLTGSVSAYTSFISNIKGGGRNKLIRMPFITYLEYIYFKGFISDYSVNLTEVDYKDSFLDYMVLKDLKISERPIIDEAYTDDAANDIAGVKSISSYSTNFLHCTTDDVRRALLLLAYRLTSLFSMESTFYDPAVGNRELRFPITDDLTKAGLLDNMSVWEAAKASMTTEQISAALSYILLSDLALCNFEVSKLDEIIDSSVLSKLWRGARLTENELQLLFGNTIQIFAANPIIYSAITEELWTILSGYVKSSQEKTADVFLFLRQKLSNREGFLRDPNIVGLWVESYLRGSYAMMNGGTPLITKSFRGAQQEEIDIVEGAPRNVLIEVTVRKEEKKQNNTYFHLAYTGYEQCFLTTKRILEKVVWNNVPIWRIPYPMLAAYFDRGEIPGDVDLYNNPKKRTKKEGDTNFGILFL
jgi:predicted AAA+ superfamily ATPase